MHNYVVLSFSCKRCFVAFWR